MEASNVVESPKSFAGALHEAADAAKGEAITIRQLTEALHERGVGMVLMIVCLPFLLPIPTMGLSAPAGFAVALYGFCVMFHLEPWLPNFICNRQISFKALQRITRFGDKLERWLKPRLKFMTWPGINALLGLSLMLSGIGMSLPLPIPGSNSVPAFAAILLLAGLIARDGVFVLAGEVMTLATVGLCIWLGDKLVDKVRTWFAMAEPVFAMM